VKNKWNLPNFNFIIVYEALCRISPHPYNWDNSSLIIVPLYFGRHDEYQASSIIMFDMAGEISARCAFLSSSLVRVVINKWPVVSFAFLRHIKLAWQLYCKV